LVATPGRLITLLRGKVSEVDDVSKARATIKGKSGKVGKGRNADETEVWDENDEEELEEGEEGDIEAKDMKEGDEEDVWDDEDEEQEDLDDEKDDDDNDVDDGTPLNLEEALKAFGDEIPVGGTKPRKISSKVPSSEHKPLESSRELLKGKMIDLSQVKFFVLDEVDRMLSLGMFPDVRHVIALDCFAFFILIVVNRDIWRFMPRGNKDKPKLERMQVYMVTATLLPRVQELMRRFAPKHLKYDLNKEMEAPKQGMKANSLSLFNPLRNSTLLVVKQFVYEVSNRRKFGLLKYLLKRKGTMRVRLIQAVQLVVGSSFCFAGKDMPCLL